MGTESFDSNDFDLFLYQMPDDVLLENRYQNNPEDVLNLQELIEPSITELTQSTSSLSPTLTTTSTTVVATTATPITVTATNEEPVIESSSLVHHHHQESPFPSAAATATTSVTSNLTTIPPIESLGLTNTSYNQQSSYNYYYCPQGVWPYCLQYCQVHGMQVYPYFNPYVRCTRPGQQVYLSPPPPPPQPTAPLAHQQAPPSVPAAGSSSTATSSFAFLTVAITVENNVFVIVAI